MTSYRRVPQLTAPEQATLQQDLQWEVEVVVSVTFTLCTSFSPLITKKGCIRHFTIIILWCWDLHRSHEMPANCGWDIQGQRHSREINAEMFTIRSFFPRLCVILLYSMSFWFYALFKATSLKSGRCAKSVADSLWQISAWERRLACESILSGKYNYINPLVMTRTNLYFRDYIFIFFLWQTALEVVFIVPLFSIVKMY